MVKRLAAMYESKGIHFTRMSSLCPKYIILEQDNVTVDVDEFYLFTLI